MNSFCTKISVTIPTYNNFESFKRALNSVLCQKFEDYEIVITDDSSNDDIKNFVEPLNNSKIKYFKNPTPLGPPENWNEGIRRASGEYIKILHHDDWLADENSLGKFIKLMEENPDSDFGYAKSVDIDTETGKIKTRNAQKYVKKLEKNCFELFFSNRIGAPSVVIFRNSNDFFFDKNLKWLVDTEFYIMCLLKNNNIAFLNEVLINIGISNTQVTKSCTDNQDVEIFEQFYVYDKYKTHLAQPEYQKELISLLKKFKIKDLENLNKIVPNDIEIPEKIIKYLSKRTKNKLCLKNFFHFS
jgi:glycosyltransferase involved in cell wall biosynthesis